MKDLGMNVFLIFVRDHNFCQLLPKELAGSGTDYLRNLADPGSVAGLIWRRGEKIVRNSPRVLLADLDQYPYPDRTSLPIEYIESLPLDVPAVLSLDKFCTNPTFRPGCWILGLKKPARDSLPMTGSVPQGQDGNHVRPHLNL
jgi:hypothetical protein